MIDFSKFSTIESLPQDVDANEVFPEKGWFYTPNEIVKDNFKRVDSNYKGRKYEVIGRKLASLSKKEKALRVFIVCSIILLIASVIISIIIPPFDPFSTATSSLALAFTLCFRKIFFKKDVECFYLKQAENNLTFSSNSQSIEFFPEELFRNILFFAGPLEVIRMGQASRTTYKAANELQLWKDRCNHPIIGLEEWTKFMCPKLEGITHPNSTYFEFKVPSIPKFAYQFLEIRGDSFDLFLNPNFTGKTFWNILSNFSPIDNFTEFRFKTNTIGPYWMLISKNYLPGSFNESPLEQERMVHQYDSKIFFDLPTMGAFSFYKFLKVLQGNLDDYYSLIKSPFVERYNSISQKDAENNEALTMLGTHFFVLQAGLSVTYCYFIDRSIVNAKRENTFATLDVASHACLSL